MSDLLTTIEEMNIEDFIINPHLSYVIETMQEKKMVAISVLSRTERDLFLITSSAFLVDSVFAGITEKHIEHIAKKGPLNYKENLLKTLNDAPMIRKSFEIAKEIDEELEKNTTKNQERVRNVIQYIKDNRLVFEF